MIKSHHPQDRYERRILREKKEQLRPRKGKKPETSDEPDTGFILEGQPEVSNK